jgi:hypothetical protein
MRAGQFALRRRRAPKTATSRITKGCAGTCTFLVLPKMLSRISSKFRLNRIRHPLNSTKIDEIQALVRVCVAVAPTLPIAPHPPYRDKTKQNKSTRSTRTYSLPDSHPPHMPPRSTKEEGGWTAGIIAMGLRPARKGRAMGLRPVWKDRAMELLSFVGRVLFASIFLLSV